MIKREDQTVNIVVRGVIIEDGELVLTEWKDKSWAFLREHLPRDLADNFRIHPRFLYSNGIYGEVKEAEELAKTFGLMTI